MRVDRPGEKLLEVVTSAAGDRRVGIARDRSGLFRLRVETWAPAWEVMGVATWLQREDEGRVADSLEDARMMAMEMLGDGLEHDEP